MAAKPGLSIEIIRTGWLVSQTTKTPIFVRLAFEIRSLSGIFKRTARLEQINLQLSELGMTLLAGVLGLFGLGILRQHSKVG
ncbi:MAG: hypothetical protein WA435_07140 [Gallionellaceae bacterium]